MVLQVQGPRLGCLGPGGNRPRAPSWGPNVPSPAVFKHGPQQLPAAAPPYPGPIRPAAGHGQTQEPAGCCYPIPAGLAGAVKRGVRLEAPDNAEGTAPALAPAEPGSGDRVPRPGPKAIFADPAGWLRERDVLLPGVPRLARPVTRERDAAAQRLRDAPYAALTGQHRREMDALLVVPPGSRAPELERWRVSPARAPGPQMVREHQAADGLSGLPGCVLRADGDRGGTGGIGHCRHPGWTRRCWGT
jgi:hypothetical protein